jgi:hypothetical protein
LLAAALVLASQWGGTPESEARKKRKKRKRQRKQTCGQPGLPPINGQCCTGAALVDGVCQACQVCGNGCRFSTVQGAIDAASAGDTIVICPGAYSENLTITRNVRLTGGVDGSGAHLTTVQAAKPAPVVRVTSASVALHQLRITGGRGEGGGIANLAGTLEVINCLVSGNSDRNANGGGIFTTGVLKLSGSTVSDNAASLGGGIYAIGGNALVELVNSQVRGNGAVNGGGIYVLENASVRVDAASRVTANTAEREGGGIFAAPSAGRIDLVSRDNVTANAPSNCEGAPVDFCSNGITR